MSKGEVTNPHTDDRVKNPEKYSDECELCSLEDVFKHLLQDMYYAENRVKNTLPKMIEKATNTDLTAGFEQHLEETKDQIQKLEEVCEIMGFKKEKEKCEAIEGLIKEGEGLIAESQPGYVRDAALIAAAQKIEHYEIASYGTLCAMANELDNHKASSLLHAILEQEKETDEKLIKLSYSINENADKMAA